MPAHCLRGRSGAGIVTGNYSFDMSRGKITPQALRLLQPSFTQSRRGGLNDAGRVEIGLAVTNDENVHVGAVYGAGLVYSSPKNPPATFQPVAPLGILGFSRDHSEGF